MRDLRYSEDIRRQKAKGLGTIIAHEAPVTDWDARLSCSFFEMNMKLAGIPDAIRRDVGAGNIRSSIVSGTFEPNFEDNLVLDTEGITLEIYKKVKDAALPGTGGPVPLYRPNKKIYCILSRIFIESDGFNISEGNIAARDQTFSVLDPPVYTANDPSIAD